MKYKHAELTAFVCPLEALALDVAVDVSPVVVDVS
jgi:hypothetical protein